MDTRDKRSSAVMHGLPFRGMLPAPGTLDAGDRAHVSFLYRGISAVTAVAAICGDFATTLFIRGTFATELAVAGAFATTLHVKGTFAQDCPCED